MKTVPNTLIDQHNEKSCNFMAIDELQSRALRSYFAASLRPSIRFGYMQKTTGMTLLTFDSFCSLSEQREKKISLNALE